MGEQRQDTIHVFVCPHCQNSMLSRAAEDYAGGEPRCAWDHSQVEMERIEVAPQARVTELEGQVRGLWGALGRADVLAGATHYFHSRSRYVDSIGPRVNLAAAVVEYKEARAALTSPGASPSERSSVPDPTCTIGKALVRETDAVKVPDVPRRYLLPLEACSGPLSPLFAPGVSEAMVRERYPHGAARAEASDNEWVALSELERWGFEDMVHAGEYLPLDTDAECPDCWGEGVSEDDGELCGGCDGTGKCDSIMARVRVGDLTLCEKHKPPALDLTALLRGECPECEGRGFVPAGGPWTKPSAIPPDRTCSTCDGTGSIPDPRLTQALDNARELGLVEKVAA